MSKFAVEPINNPMPKTPDKIPSKVNYDLLWENATIRPAKMAELTNAAIKIKSGRSSYEKVAEKLGNGIPWWFIAIVHYMEAGAYRHPFEYHLHCGDKLTARTTHVPAGRPKANPGGGTRPPSINNPYTWEESALDALRYMGYDKIDNWSIHNCLYLFEKFNGAGYIRKGINSPYLWSYTNQYGTPPNVGKYTSDHGFDPNVISKQPGVAALMKALDV